MEGILNHLIYTRTHVPVDVVAVPGIGELDVGVGLENTSEQGPFQHDPEVNAAEGGGDVVWGELHPNG